MFVSEIRRVRESDGLEEAIAQLATEWVLSAERPNPRSEGWQLIQPYIQQDAQQSTRSSVELPMCPLDRNQAFSASRLHKRGELLDGLIVAGGDPKHGLYPI